jgi:hypothetical protein
VFGTFSRVQEGLVEWLKRKNACLVSVSPPTKYETKFEPSTEGKKRGWGGGSGFRITRLNKGREE